MILSLLACAAPEVDGEDWSALAAGAGWPDEGGAPIPVPEALTDLEWLGDVSGWGAEGVPAGRATAGSWGVGNGVVFGIIGLDAPWNTVTNAIGPGYQADAGFFGDAALTLAAAGVALPVTYAQVQRPRGTAIVRTLAEGDGVQLLTTDVAPPGAAYLLRHVTVRNMEAAERELTVRWSLARADGEIGAEAAGGLLQQRGARWMRLDCPGAILVEDALNLDMVIPANSEASFVCTQSFASGAEPGAPSVDAVADLNASRAETVGWLSGATHLEGGDPKVADLIEGMLITTHLQTAAVGLPSPMNRYTSGWLRDIEGPVRLWLRAGRHEDALTALRSLWLGELAKGGIYNSFSLDFDPDAVSLPGDPVAFWAAAPFMEGREPVEAPSYAPLLHAEAAAWTAGASSDDPWDAQRNAFLDACVDRQLFEEGPEAHLFLPFSGDETFRWPMAFAVGAPPEEIGWSANSTFLWRAAARTRGRDPSSASDDPFWTGTFWSPIVRYEEFSTLSAPYEDIALQPASWEAGLDEDRLGDHIDATIASLLQADGLLLSRLAGTGEDNVGFTGMVPGMFLRAAARRHHAAEAVAFAALDLVATPSGHFEELHGSDGLPLALTHTADGQGGDVPARFRPWEGGLTVAALLDYLVGLEPGLAAGARDGVTLSPHLPAGWSGFALRDLRVRELRFDVEVAGFEEGVVVTLRGLPGVPVDLTLHGPKAIQRVDVEDEEVVITPGDVVRLPTFSGGDVVEVRARW